MNSKNYNPKSWEDFKEYVEEIESQPHGYNSIADALTQSTVAFFNYFASKHGMTGFQASWSQMQIIATLRNMEAPFMIVDSSKLLYPQYDVENDVKEFLKNSKAELSKIAKKNLEENNEFTSQRVIARWEELAAYNNKL